MGFIDYHGTKEDRFSEVVDFARSQQEEDFRRKQHQKIKSWLNELTVDVSLADSNIQDLLKLVIIKYSKLKDLENAIFVYTHSLEDVDHIQKWNDFSVSLAMRHIEPFHLEKEVQKKHLDSMLNRIFKIDDVNTQLIESPSFKRYIIECFDPTWTGQHYYKYLYVSAKKNAKKDSISEFLATYRILGLVTALYLYEAIHPKDDGWMIQEEAEWKALCALEDKIKRDSLSIPDKSFYNSILSKEKSDSRPENKKDIVEEPGIRSKLDRVRFKECLSKGDIPAYVTACKLLLECEMPEEIKGYYEQLVDRMEVLKDAIDKFDSVYHADLDQFNEYFVPETLNVTATYLDYQVASPSEAILKNTRENVLIAVKKLVQVVNEKIDEIYMFVTIDTNAEAKALETVMIQNGYVDSEFKINN